MRRQTRGSTGRRGTAVAASAAALCLGAGLLSGCGSGSGDGYTAVGAASGSSKPPPDGAPSGDVTLTPLDESGGGSGSGSAGGGGRGGGGTSPSGGTSPNGGTSPSAGPSPSSGAGAPSEARTGAPSGSQAVGSSGGPGAAPTRPADPSPPSKKPGGSPGSPSSSSNPPPPSPTNPTNPKPPPPPPTPAALTLSAPQRAAADKRWCEKVTVEFRNTGGSPARSGTVTFATHIIGALGVDWATITSSQPLPAPIGAGSTRSETYTVCVESWRVPLGMRVETQDVSAVWE
nr:hypothetical protein [Streptomyces sp. PTY087I2]